VTDDDRQYRMFSDDRKGDIDHNKIAAAKRRREFEEKIDRDERLTAATRTVGRELLRWVNSRHGYAWPAAETLAKKLGLSERTVRRGMKQLQKYGYFACERRPGRPTLSRPIRELPRTPPTPDKMSGVVSGVLSGVTPDNLAGEGRTIWPENPGQNVRRSHLKRSTRSNSPRPVSNSRDNASGQAAGIREEQVARTVPAPTPPQTEEEQDMPSKRIVAALMSECGCTADAAVAAVKSLEKGGPTGNAVARSAAKAAGGPGLYPRNGIWWGRVCVNGKEHRRSMNTRDFEIACERVKPWREGLLLPSTGSPAGVANTSISNLAAGRRLKVRA